MNILQKILNASRNSTSRKVPPRNTEKVTRRQLQVRSLVKFYDRYVNLETVRSHSNLQRRHQRATKLMGVQATRAVIPSYFVRTLSLSPTPWWTEEEVKKEDVLFPGEKSSSGIKKISEEEYPIELLNGKTIRMVRRVLLRENDGKRFKEYLAVDEDGSVFPYNSILRDLIPLYLGEELNINQKDAITIVESTGPADSLKKRGIKVVGTMTGAFVAPSVSALEPLMRAEAIYLWPDNDAVGVRHMNLIAARLDAMGHKNIRVIRWRGGPRKGDAADFTGSDEELKKLYEDARKWSKDERIDTRGILTVQPRHSIVTRLQLEDDLKPPMPKIELSLGE